MPDIKLKENKKRTIKTINKDLSKVKDNIISVKNKTKENYESNYDTGTEYASNKMSETISNAPNNIYRVNKTGKNNFKQTKENIYKIKENINTYKKKSKIKKEQQIYQK